MLSRLLSPPLRCQAPSQCRGAARTGTRYSWAFKLARGGSGCKEACPWRQPVTRWMAANVAVAQDPAGNLKPAKDKGTERIDGIVALIMAIGRALVAQEEPQPEYSLHFV
jgi:hypothetical protein